MRDDSNNSVTAGARGALALIGAQRPATHLTRLPRNESRPAPCRPRRVALYCGRNAWIYSASVEPETQAEQAAWREVLPAGYDAVSPIRRPRAFARALGTMAAPSRPARGASRPAAERGGRRGVLHGPPEAPGGPSGGSAPFLSHQENRQGRVRRLRHVVRTARRSRVRAGRLRPVLHASLHQVRKGTTGCTTDRDSRLGEPVTTAVSA